MHRSRISHGPAWLSLLLGLTLAIGSLLPAALVFAANSPAPAAPLSCTSDTADAVSWMNQYNLIVLDDLQGPFNETEGRTFVGNNFTYTGSSNFAIAMPASTACSDRTFVVAGSSLPALRSM